MTPSTIQIIAAALFFIAIAHTFATRFFERLAHKNPRHAGIWHLLGEVEIVFGFWAMVLVLLMFAIQGSEEATKYIDTRNFTEPLFVFTVMVMSGTRPILQTATALVAATAKLLHLPGSSGSYLAVLILAPLLGSFITEPAAMTLAAMLLGQQFLSREVSEKFKYATLGVLFVNVSIGGTLTNFAAPPVLMVATPWQWDMGFMLTHFGWKAALAVCVNAIGVTVLFRKELVNLPPAPASSSKPVPAPLIAANILLLAGVVVFAHHPAIFLGMFLLFLGLSSAYMRHSDRLILREALLVAFFLAGLVVLGGLQQWWLQPVLLQMNSNQVFFGATILTAFTDNAALTYLGSLVSGLSDEFKYALVAGAVTGGGLTVIANAPNPAGMAILRPHFKYGAVKPLGLLMAALPATIVAGLAFLLL